MQWYNHLPEGIAGGRYPVTGRHDACGKARVLSYFYPRLTQLRSSDKNPVHINPPRFGGINIFVIFFTYIRERSLIIGRRFRFKNALLPGTRLSHTVRRVHVMPWATPISSGTTPPRATSASVTRRWATSPASRSCR